MLNKTLFSGTSGSIWLKFEIVSDIPPDLDGSLQQISRHPAATMGISAAFSVGNHLYCQIDHSSSVVGGSLPQAKALSVLHSLLPALTKLTFVSAVTALTLDGLTTPNCVRKVEKSLHGLGPGLLHCDIDLSEGRAVVEYDPGLLSPGRLLEAVAALDGGKFSARLHRDFESAVRGTLRTPVATKEDDPSGFQGLDLFLFDPLHVLLIDCCTLIVAVPVRYRNSL